MNKKKPASAGKYYEGIGRRKTATARVRLFQKEEGFIINGKELENYFFISELRKIVKEALLKNIKVSVHVAGGGIRAQAEAIRLGIARALVKIDESHRPALKIQGFLSRDPRKVERKKPGLKKARRAAQWSKR